MRRHPHRFRRRRPRLAILLAVLVLIVLVQRCRNQGPPANIGRTADAPDRRQEISGLLAPKQDVAPRDGLAAAIVIDVSGSMDDRVTGEDGRRARKIDVARRAARDLVERFAAYAEAHTDEQVLLGIYEFSRRDGEPDCRPIIPMGAPDRSRADDALARLDPGGGTPIGQAMVTAKQALDATGMSRRHLLMVSDGENTDGFRPDEVAAAIAVRPEAERPSIYFVAFDVDARRFNRLRDAGALVMSAGSGRELNETLDILLEGKILIEK